MRDLLFEIGTEELPHWYVRNGSEALAELLTERLAAAGLPAGTVTAYGTPRRLAVIARQLPPVSERSVEELKGPPAAVAFAEDGTPTRAATAFASRSGVEVGALAVRGTERGDYVYARVERGGEPAELLLPPLLAALVRDLPAPRKMRWGEEPTPFLRPVAWLLALYGEEPLKVEAAGVSSGATTRGHRFLAPHEIRVESPAAYEETLKDAWVLVDRRRRKAATEEGITALTSAAGLAPFASEELLDEVTDLVEWPFPIMGEFSADYLTLPREVLTTVMITHQRFFPAELPSGELAAKFVGVSNNRVTNEAVVRRGYEQVLEGRLYDARFFFESDVGRSLSQHAWGLSGIAFQEELGSMADKLARVGSSAGRLVKALSIGAEEAEHVRVALPIFRADLATAMVYEFPELEGVMARAYALAEGLPVGVADALLGGVKPRTHDDDVPATAAGAVLALADRADKLTGFFALGRRPSGSADPYGLRRDALAIARILAAYGFKLPVSELMEAAAAPYAESAVSVTPETQREVVEFVWDRVAALLQERVSVPVVRAAIRGSSSIIGAARRAELLNVLARSAEFADLMALYKRAANLAGKADESAEVNPALFKEEPEAPLHAALEVARTGVQRLLAIAAAELPAWDIKNPPARSLTGLGEAVSDVVSLKAPLDEFLDGVLVMVDDARIRHNRLALLAETVEALRRLGELGELEGTGPAGN